MNPATPSEIAAAYNEWAETYDQVENRTRDLAGDVLRQVSLGPRAPSLPMSAQREIERPGPGNLKLAGQFIIEVGCGTGRNTEWLAQFGAREIVGLDFSEAMLARARVRVADERVRFVQHDVRESWPLGNALADLVVVMLVLEHVEHLPPIFAEAARVMNTAGELFICELHPMRQLLGGQAQFTSAQTGTRQLVPAFLHDVSDYVNVGLSAGLELTHLGEWRDEGAAPEELPRLLSLRFRKRSAAL
jgi:2-polyprenyl-3-methyl-5-hydroxy-6-metoxy-1,4-benzoquinol methylase